MNDKTKPPSIRRPLEEQFGAVAMRHEASAPRIAASASARRSAELGYRVTDMGDLRPAPASEPRRLSEGASPAGRRRLHPRHRREYLPRRPQRKPAGAARRRSQLSSMGSVSGMARRAAELGRPLFVLWLDAHADFNTPETSPSGNIHGMPVAFFCGKAEFAAILPAGRPFVDPRNVYQVGIRSVDDEERLAIKENGVNVFDMRAIDEDGMGAIYAPDHRRCLQGQWPAACQPRRRFPRSGRRTGRRHNGSGAVPPSARPI